MAQKLDKILVVDVEATCWEGKPPAGASVSLVPITIKYEQKI